jgi:hypothetical protein
LTQSAEGKREYLTAQRRASATPVCVCVCVFITTVPITKLFAWGEGDSGGRVLRETTSRGLCGLVCPSRTSERGGEGNGHSMCGGPLKQAVAQVRCSR